MTTGHVLVIGGSSGLGLALAGLLLSGGAEVTIASRSAERLAAAAAHLRAAPDRLRTQVLDIRDEDGVRRGLEASVPVHHIAVTAADATRATGPLGGFPHSKAVAFTAEGRRGPRNMPAATNTAATNAPIPNAISTGTYWNFIAELQVRRPPNGNPPGLSRQARVF